MLEAHTHRILLLAALLAFLMAADISAQAAGENRLTIVDWAPSHPVINGQPRLLIGCSDRYGLFRWDSDKGFNWQHYLRVSHDAGLNYVRHDVCAWHGLRSTVRYPAQFSKLSWPFARTGPGTAMDGKPRFDLTRFDEDYFAERLRPSLKMAEELDITCELTLFDDIPHQSHFPQSLWGDDQNINALGLTHTPGPTSDAALVNPRLLAIQEAYVTKVLEETRDFGNVIYEIANETGGARWVEHFVDFIHRSLPGALVSAGEQNSAYDPVTGGCDIVVKHRGTGGLYVSDDDVARHRASLIAFRRGGKPVSHNEFFLFANRSTDDPNFVRKMFWANFTAGGHANFYDFRWWGGTGDSMEEGELSQPPPDEIMNGARYLRRFVEQTQLPFWQMEPMDDLVSATTGHAFCYGKAGEVYVIYTLASENTRVTTTLVPGQYELKWYDPLTGAWLEPGRTVEATDRLRLRPPQAEVVAYLRRVR